MNVEEERREFITRDRDGGRYTQSKSINNQGEPGEDKYNRKKFTKLEEIGLKIWEFIKWVETKLFALGSIALAVYLIYYSNFFKVLYEHSKVDSLYFYLALIFYLKFTGIILYLSVYLPVFKNIHEDKWDSYCPNMIPVASMCAVGGTVTLIICVWDVWRWWSIPLVIIIQWGLLMTAHFAPRGALGSAVCVALIVGMLISGYYIEHEGYLH